MGIFQRGKLICVRTHWTSRFANYVRNDGRRLRLLVGPAYRETLPYSGKGARYYLVTTGQYDVSFLINPALGHPEHREYPQADYRQTRILLPLRLPPVLDWAQVTAADGVVMQLLDRTQS